MASALRRSLGGSCLLGALALSAAACSLEPTSSQQAAATEADSRAAWVRSEIAGQNEWLDDETRAAKYDKMKQSAFSFYRGTNHLFWADFGADPRLEQFGGSGARTWIQGDLHVENFGAFHDDDGRIVYDLNDFDETIVADYQYDLWRAAVSLVLVADQQQLPDGTARAAVDTFTETYLDTVEDYRGNDGELDDFVDAAEASPALAEFLAVVAAEESRRKMLDKWTLLVDGVRTLNTEYKKLAAVSDAEAQSITAGFVSYGQSLTGGLDWSEEYFAIKGIAHRLNAGTGSLGVARYYVLIEGPTADQNDDVILDVKQTLPATGLSYDGDSDGFGQSESHRAVLGHQALGVNVDDHLGWMLVDGTTFLVRERSPYKETFPIDEITNGAVLVELAGQWGRITATAHARADEDYDDDYVSYSFDKRLHQRTDEHHDEVRALVWEIASTYAAQAELDYQAFLPMTE
ncbi:MAG: DUF2252 family protein [Deltaproteobacteria bacterium]|nr:DUF2252 family protein [Deltaproteobacteria bacterium]MBW2535752.1 DUF2252 family protein [Deltaproteobacteria bacterium]